MPATNPIMVVLPTYNEAANLAAITAAVLAAAPEGTGILVVDDDSPDGTGGLADELAAADPRIDVLHRTAKQGLGPAYIAGFRRALDGGAERIVQMVAAIRRGTSPSAHATSRAAGSAIGERAARRSRDGAVRTRAPGSGSTCRT